MWKFFIYNNRFAYLFLVALVGVGVYAALATPRESAPEVVIPVGVVTTVLPGAPAADIESLITNEIERGLASLANVSQITSQSRESVSVVTVEFDASADVDASIDELKDAIDVIAQDLPPEAEDPQVAEVDFVNQPILTVAIGGNVAESTFTDLADALEREVESIAGVSRVTFSGVRDREVTVIVDPIALVRYELTLNEITRAIQSANLTLPIGQIENNGISYNIAFEGDITAPSEIANVGITTRGGQPVFVRDVATVVDGLAPASTLSRLSVDGAPSTPSITMDVYKQSGGDITRVTAAVNTRLTELQADGLLLSGYSVDPVIDAGEQIKTDLRNLTGSGLQTVFLVVLLLVVAIGWREGLLAGLAVPLSFLIGFIGLYFSGNTINFLSLFSLILGVGILVDSSIVMVEGINRKMKDNPTIDKRQAALETIDEFKAPLISGTLTTVAMFVGLFIVSGVIGQFIASIPFTLIFLLFASMFVSLAIIPLFAASFLRRRSDTKIEQLQVEYAHRFESWYKAKLGAVLGNRRSEQRFLWGIRIALIVCLLFPAMGLVKVVFFEQGDVDYVIVTVEEPEGTVKEFTDRGVREVEEVLYTVSDIESYTVTVGSGSQFAGGGQNEKLANMLIVLKDDREQTSTEVVAQLQEKLTPLSHLNISVTQPSDGPPTGAAIVIKLLGDDLAALTSLGNQAAEIFRQAEGITNVETSTNVNTTEFVLELDRAKAASFGVDPFTISQLARTAVFGTEATALTTAQSDIAVIVKLNVDPSTAASTETTNRATVADLSRIEVPTVAGLIPLGEFVRVSLRESSTAISHEDQERVVTVTADVLPGVNAREAQAGILETIERELQLPQGVTLSTGGGETEESNQAFLEMFLALVVGVGLMLAILVLQFNSFRHTWYVLSILPYSLIGIMIGLAVTGSPLSFPSIMGFIALSGIVVNNSILLIDVMNESRRREPEKVMRDIVLDGAGSRLRPILLTTATTVIGMVPLTWAGDLWAPLAFAVMFGLVFSVLITLVLIPIVYLRKPGELAN